jgi:hypothetical protein
MARGSKSSSGKGTGKSSPMTGRAAARVQSTGDSKPGSSTGVSGWAPRAQRAAAKNASGGRGGPAGKGQRG